MKSIFLMVAALAITSCSKNKNSVNKAEEVKNEVVFEALSVRTSSVDGQNTIPASTLDFATLQPKQSGSQDLIITNGIITDLVFGSSDIDASNISPFVMTESCSNKTILRNRSCKLTFTVLNSPNPVETVLTKSLTIKGSVVQLTATLAADPTPVNAPVEGVSVSPNLLDFGLMKDGEIKELSIAVTNRGTTTQTIAAPVISNPKLTVTSNTCTSLARNRSCSIKVRYTALNDESISQQSFTSIANNDIKYSVLVQSPTVNEPQILAINPQTSASSLNLNEPQIQNATLSFTNTGTVELPAPLQAIAQPSTGVTINSVSCTGGLSRGRNCSVSYSLNSALLAGGSSSVQLRLQSGTIASNIHTINLNVTKLAVPCNLSDVQANGWNTENQASISGMKTGSDVSQCIVQSCNQYFSLNTSAKSCQADACTIANANTFGVSLSNVASVSGNTPNCVVSSCSNPSLFDISPDQKSCVDKPLACTLSDAQSNGWNITNAQTPTGIKVGANISQCSVSVCNANFALNSTTKSCDAISCTLANASGNGVTSILNVTTVLGTLPNCSVSSCDANYKPAADSKSCVAKLCNELNAGELSALGFNTTNATISGTYPSCSLTCNSSLQQLAGDNKSCVDKTPTGSIAFAQSYTKNTTGNQLNITQTNAQQIQFYSDASCSIVAGAPLSMPLSQISINLSSGDGTKTAYAKLINGSASSSCLSASIILDQTAPSLEITSPLNNTDIAGSSLTVSGNCSEVNNPTVQVGVTINGVTQNVNCSSGTFSSVFNISSIAVGSYTIAASATDLANNTGTASINFNKIDCTSFQTLSGNSCSDNVISGTNFNINSSSSGTVYTNQNTVTLDLSSISGAQTMAISQQSCVNNNSLEENFSTTKDYLLTTLNTSGVLSIKFRNGTQTLCLSRNLIHDNIAPQTISGLNFSDPEINGINGSISPATWNSSFDGLSGILRYEYAIGSSISNTIKDWTSTSQVTSYSGNTESLIDGVSYQFKVRAIDRAGNISIPTTLDIISIYRKTSISKVAVGDNFNCAIKNYGVVCWGINDKGQLGVNYNTITGSSTPVQTSLTSGVTDISADGKTACAIKDSKLYCWGDNLLGQLGLGFEGSVRDTPTEVTTIGSNISAVAVGGRHVCVIKLGKVYCWGENQYGALGQGTAPTTTSVDALYSASPIPVCTASTCTVANTANHLSNVTKISVGYAHSCAISDNKAYCWGYNNKGQVGTGNTTNTGLATLLFSGASNIYDIATGLAHTCVVRMGQTGSPAAYSLRFGCWGGQLNGALGDGVVTDTIKHISSIANVATTGSITMIKAGIYNTCISSTVGVTTPTTMNLKCWGLNNRGQVGNSALTAATYSTEASVGSRYSDNTTFASVYDVDMNSHNEFGVTTTNSHICASDAGKISCWGYNGNGFSQLNSIIGDASREPLSGDNSVITTPYIIPSLIGNTYQSIAVGGSNACVVHNGALKCWGSNANGQLGNGTIIASTTPVTPTGFDKSVTQVVTSDSTVCAVRAGALFCWGLNNRGQVGNNSTTSPVTIPFQVIASDVISVSSNSVSTAASVAGTGYGWGDNAFFVSGEPAYSGLGIYTYPASGSSRLLVPSIMCGVGATTCTTTPLLNVTKISKHGDGGIAITAGKAVSWGRSTSLGNNPVAGWSRVPVNVVNSSNVQESGIIDISARLYSSYSDFFCLMRINGQGYCWGDMGDNSGISGVTYLDKYVTPIGGTSTPLTGLSSFSPNISPFSASCAKKMDRLTCWGTNPASGLYADDLNPASDSRLPTTITTLPSNVGISSIARYMGCAEHNGQIKCWGNIGREASSPQIFGPSTGGVLSSPTPNIFNINYAP